MSWNSNSPLTWPLRKHLLWLVVALVVKGAFFLYFIHESGSADHQGRWAVYTSDTWEYVDPAESLLAKGSYTPDHRMPGFAAPYYALRLFMEQGPASDVIIALQLLFSCMAMYALALMTLALTGSWRVFIISYALLLTALFPARSEIELMTDSFCTSAICLHVALLVLHLRTGARWMLIAAGLMLTWTFFLRPIYVLLFPLEVLVLCARPSIAWRTRIRAVLLFLLPCAAIDGAWTVRNLLVHQALHPLTNGLYNPKHSASPYYALQQFVQAYGGNYNFWGPASDMRWFGMREGLSPGQAPLPDAYRELRAYVYTSAYNRDSLLIIRDLMTRLRDTSLTTAGRDSLTARVWELTTRYRTAFAREKPFQYQVMARLRLLEHLVVHSGSSVIFSRPMDQLAWWEKGLKLYQSALYWAAMVIGTFASVWVLLRRRRDAPLLIIACVALYGMFIHPFTIRLCEVRYLAPTFPITVIVMLLGCWYWMPKALRDRIASVPRSNAS